MSLLKAFNQQNLLAFMSATVLTLSGTTAANAGVKVSTLPMPGLELNEPVGVVVIGDKIYFAERGNRNESRVVEYDTTTAIPTPKVIAGRGVGIDDDTNDPVVFHEIMALGKDGAGNLYVTEHQKDIVRKITLDVLNPARVKTIAGRDHAYANGDAVGTGTLGSFMNPVGVAGDATGDNIFVAGYTSHAVQKIRMQNNKLETRAGHPPGGNVEGYQDTINAGNNSGNDARFRWLSGIVVDPNGTGVVYVADNQNHAIRKMTPNTANSGYQVETIAGSPPSAGPASGWFPPSAGAQPALQPMFYEPWDVDLDAAGNIYVADRLNNAIRMISEDSSGDYEVTTIVGLGRRIGPVGSAAWNASPSGGYGYFDGDETNSLFRNPYDLAVTPDGCNIYVADFHNHKIRKIERCGLDLTIDKTIKSRNKFETTFLLTVGGNGEDLQASDVIYVRDVLSPGVAIQNISGPGWICSPTSGANSSTCNYTLGNFPPAPIVVKVVNKGTYENCARVRVKRPGVGPIETNLSNNDSCVLVDHLNTPGPSGPMGPSGPLGPSNPTPPDGSKPNSSLSISKTVIAGNAYTAKNFSAVVDHYSNLTNPASYDVNVDCGAFQQTVQATTGSPAVIPNLAAGLNCHITELPTTVALPNNCLWETPSYSPNGAVTLQPLSQTSVQIENSIICK